MHAHKDHIKYGDTNLKHLDIWEPVRFDISCVLKVCDTIIDVVCVFDLRVNKRLNIDMFIKCHIQYDCIASEMLD